MPKGFQRTFSEHHDVTNPGLAVGRTKSTGPGSSSSEAPADTRCRGRRPSRGARPGADGKLHGRSSNCAPCRRCRRTPTAPGDTQPEQAGTDHDLDRESDPAARRTEPGVNAE